MKYFGKPYDAPVYIAVNCAPTPVGQQCLWCGEPIGLRDAGFMLPFVGDDKVSEVPYHRACLLREILGSLSHVKRQCSCYVPGATCTCTDPPEMTLREAAEAVVEYMERA